jgi:hypothetical protein
MRTTALAVVSVIALLSACGPSGPSGTGSTGGAAAPAGAGGGFPIANNVSFRQEGTMTVGGQSIPQVTYHDGAKVRTEMNGPMGQMIMVVNNDTHEGFQLANVMGRQIATRMDLSQQSANPVSRDQITQMRADMAKRAHQIGTCSAAGETGTDWEMTPPEGVDTGTDQRSMCVTSDGIMLQMKINGQVMFNTTSIQRGPQDPSLFVPPAGVHFTEVHAPSQTQINAAVARARAAAAAHGAP